VHTAAEPLPTTQPSTWTYRHFQTIFFKDPLHLIHQKNCLSLIEPRSIYTLPWLAIPVRADYIYIIFYYFRADYPLTQSIILRAPYISEFLQYLNPTSWAFYPKILMWDVRYPTIPQHNHHDSSRVTCRHN